MILATGTLEVLNPVQKKYLSSLFKINNYIHVPSIFADSKLCFQEDPTSFKICDRTEYFMEIVSEIDKRILGKKNSCRAVMVFFENMEILDCFSESDSFKKYSSSYQKLTELLNYKEKIIAIRKATRAGTVSLLTKSFGRGTDFIVYDNEVIGNGGVHVIQTFFSEELSEEVQIKGRTARQGEQGSFSMILNLDELEKFGFTQNHHIKIKGFEAYNIIATARDELITNKYQKVLSSIKITEEIHKLSMELIGNKNPERMLEILLEFNSGCIPEKVI